MRKTKLIKMATLLLISCLSNQLLFSSEKKVKTDDIVDDIITIREITAGDSFKDPCINPEFLISLEGMTPINPTDLSKATFQRVGWKAWHTSGDNNKEAWLLFKFNKIEKIQNLFIWNLNQPFEGPGNRDSKDITISYSQNSTNGTDGDWEELGDYIIPKTVGDNAPGYALTPYKHNLKVEINKQARFVRLQIKSSYGAPHWGLGKLFFTRNNSNNKDQLILQIRTLLANSKDKKFYKYTQTSWKNWLAALNEGENMLDNVAATEEEIEAIINSIQTKEAALEESTNLLINATANSTDVYDNLADYNASKSIDNNWTTRWASQKGKEFTVTYDLQENKHFNNLLLFENQTYPNRIRDLEISTSENNTDFTEWRKKSFRGQYISVVGDEVNARYIKVTFKNSDEKGINVDEVMLFNDLEASETKDPTPLRPIDPDWIKQTPSTEITLHQKRKVDLKYGMFIHYGMNTFAGQEWTDGSYPANTYHPNNETLDPDSWVKAAYDAGMNYIVLITKHHDGFALWKSKAGDYNIGTTGREDEVDIVKAVSDACYKYGVKFCVYYSCWDRHWDRTHTMANTGLDQRGLNQLLVDYEMDQLRELLSGNYGEISEIWIDGAWEKANEEWEFAKMYNLVKRLQPNCQFGINCTIHNPKNGSHVLPPKEAKGGEEMQFFPSDFRSMDPYMTKDGANEDPKLYKHNGEYFYLPFEATICINKTWFWNSGHSAATTKTAKFVVDTYTHLIAQNNTLVLNVSPTTNGVFNQFDLDVLNEGARQLGIARGNARANKIDGECCVEIRYLDTDNNLVTPTVFLYGKEGEEFDIATKDLGYIGYEFQTIEGENKGTFTTDKRTVTFKYEDKGEIINSKPQVALEENCKIYQQQGRVEIVTTSPFFLTVKTLLGQQILSKEFPIGKHQIKLPKGLFLFNNLKVLIR